MTTHKAIRDALEVLPAICEWSSDELGVWMVDDPFDTFICGAEDAQEATFIAACNPAAIRALLADLDAKTAEVEALRREPMTDESIITEAARHLGEMHVEHCGLNDIKAFARAIEAHHHITQKEQG